ncbi:hypothetical protein AB4Y45_32385 [Paraburkholderia sp. EG287A]|uniref:DUF7007 domain-containing protein n=1 Tax=Paraburkholderia sp. EG287A TaxID=3237012 RepID=UPI0034D209B8
MGHHFDFLTGSAPFVPGSMALPKKKAKELKHMVPRLSLSKAQEVIAQAYNWLDWYSLDQAVRQGAKASLPDELVSEEEADARYGDQVSALLQARIKVTDVERLVAELGLTCSGPTARKRLADAGPWGKFQEDIIELAPGITRGLCSRYTCYRLSPERSAQIPPNRRLDTNGWYMLDDHGWRVELSFPEHFPERAQAAWKQFERNEPYIFELETGKEPEEQGFNFAPSLAKRSAGALAAPNAWFALTCFPYSAFSGDISSPDGRCIVGCIRGRDLIGLMAANGLWQTQPALDVAWFGLPRETVFEVFTLQASDWDTRISGLRGWRLPSVAPMPFRRAPFGVMELFDGELTLPADAVDCTDVSGPVVLIE